MADALQKRIEGLGPAERIVQTLTTFTDHLFHGRAGLVTKAARNSTGVHWEWATKRKQEDGSWVVFRKTKVGKKTVEVRAGVLGDDGKTVKLGRALVGEFRNPGISPEVAVYLYRQVADVFLMDNEFVAHWASWAAARDERDLKIVLSAFLLVQNRSGEPVFTDDGDVEFHDEDFREVGEAMCLLRNKKAELSPKALLRVGTLLKLDGVAAINRELGFGKSARTATLGRYVETVRRWLGYREANPKMLDGLVKGNMQTIVKSLAKLVHYKPTTEYFVETLRWKQKQAKGGHRTFALGKAVKAAQSWKGLDEQAVCEKIVTGKLNYKGVVGLLGTCDVGLTRAVVLATLEAGGLSKADLIMYSPTFEELGLLVVPAFKTKWDDAMASATNTRAANVARNVKSKEAQDGLQKAADVATAKVIEKVTKDLRTYFIIDISSSMGGLLARMVTNLTKFLGGFPLDRTHVSVFNTVGREVTIKAASAAGVRQAFRSYSSSGGTNYASGVNVLARHKPKAGEDALIIFAGDEEDYGGYQGLVQAIQRSGINPVAIGLLMAKANNQTVVRDAARELGLPCVVIDDQMFDDPYFLTTLSNLIAATPVGAVAVGQPAARRKGLIEEILETDLLSAPLWSRAA